MYLVDTVGENSFFEAPRCNVRLKNVQALWSSVLILTEIVVLSF